MITLVYSERFLRRARRLPPKQQEKLSYLLEILAKNQFHKLLHTKHLSGNLAGLYSFRITRDWRVIFRFISPREIHLIDTANRKEIYK